MDFLALLKQSYDQGRIPEKIYVIFEKLYAAYVDTLTAANIDFSEHVKGFVTYLRLVENQLASPYRFEPFHQKIRAPFDHYQFAVDLFTPMIDAAHSLVLYPKHLDRIERQLDMKENVILFANHQTEVDPVLMYITLGERNHHLASKVIFVAGDRVISDPVAVPLSLGCDLLCIYSKRYIDVPPERREQKILHNQRTMKRMKELLSEGGRIIYVAPSGGRDRTGKDGQIILAPFDPAAIEMFRLMAKQSGVTTHFYPLALKTYHILPPPQTIEVELGELRVCSRQPAHFAFGDEIDMESIATENTTDRHAMRDARAQHIFNCMKTLYDRLP